jgi:hypothetical protein
MRFAISIPQLTADGAFDPAAFRHHLTRAEALGFDSAWTQEQVLGAAPTLGPIETLTYAARSTWPRASPRWTSSAEAASRSVWGPEGAAGCSPRSASTPAAWSPGSTKGCG